MRILCIHLEKTKKYKLHLDDVFYILSSIGVISNIYKYLEKQKKMKLCIISEEHQHNLFLNN